MEFFIIAIGAASLGLLGVEVLLRDPRLAVQRRATPAWRTERDSAD